MEGGGGAATSSIPSEGEGQTWSQFIQEESVPENGDTGRTISPPNQQGLRATSRKRRLGSNSSDAAEERAQIVAENNLASSSSRSHRSRQTSSGNSSGLGVPGSTPENAINASASPQFISRQINSLRHRERSFTDFSLPKWQPDSEVSSCPICGTDFSFWYRKHHCRKCGRVVCASCSPHRITIPRQFIVRPPATNRALSTIIQPTPSEPQVISLISDDDDDDTQASSNLRPREVPPQQSNPALGGGEEVRLCNPCVPDPNPEPPRRYGLMGIPIGEETPGSEQLWSGSRGRTARLSDDFSPSHRSSDIFNRLPPFHRPSASLSSVSGDSDAIRELRRQRGHGMIFRPEPPGIHRPTPGALPEESLPSYGAFNYTLVPSFRGIPPSRSSHALDPQISPPAYSSSTASAPSDLLQRSSSLTSRSIPSRHRSRSHLPPFAQGVDHNRPLPPPPPIAGHRRRPDESDFCPVCNHRLPPRGRDGNEEAREVHIRRCIENQAPGEPSGASAPAGQAQMVHFIATEKDCIGHDGGPQECSICMEEYEVGAQLTRLLCFCKFHQSCIIDWFNRKEECPVHKVLA